MAYAKRQTCKERPKKAPGNLKKKNTEKKSSAYFATCCMLSTACELCTYLLLLVPSTLPSLESDAYRHEITTIGGKKKKEEKQKTRKQRKDPQNK